MRSTTARRDDAGSPLRIRSSSSTNDSGGGVKVMTEAIFAGETRIIKGSMEFQMTTKCTPTVYR